MFDMSKILETMSGGIEASEQQAYQMERIADALTVVVLRMAVDTTSVDSATKELATEMAQRCVDRLLDAADYETEG